MNIDGLFSVFCDLVFLKFPYVNGTRGDVQSTEVTFPHFSLPNGYGWLRGVIDGSVVC